MKSGFIPKEAVDEVKITNYQEEDRDIVGNIEIAIHFKDHPAVEHIDHNVVMVKANMFNAVELNKTLNKVLGEQ